jgi:predicted metal-dependent peptidase
MQELDAYVSPIWKEQTALLELADVCGEILRDARNELYLSMRFLDVPLNALTPVPDGKICGLGTDGSRLFYQMEFIAELYRKNRIYINRACLHTLFHCLLGHMWARKWRDPELWSLACDISVEALADGLKKACVHLPIPSLRRELYGHLEQELAVLNAESVYRALQGLSEKDRERLCVEFCRDDHTLWEQREKPHSRALPRNSKEDWDEMRARVQMELEAQTGEASDGEKDFKEHLAVENRERYDYRSFLRKFSVQREALQVDPDAFDYVFYTYGLSLYKNMPLIEPLETREIRKVEDFAVVIDTSMSCSGELVKRFLEETYTVLAESESFFKKVNIHIIQCDDKVRQDVKIEDRESLLSYMDGLELFGLGGTDFRPAFLYVEQLIREGRFDRLKGLLYFTDGRGIFPVKMPPFDTAFVFVRDRFTDADVPPWAMKVVLDAEELMETGCGKQECMPYEH